jgi:uncharacterized glyoxalase superfamily protein PhnB
MEKRELRSKQSPSMKLSFTRLVTSDVLVLADFYKELLGIPAIGSEDYAQLHATGASLALSSKCSVDLFNAGAAEAASNRSLILDFEVSDVDREYSRLQRFVPTFVLEPTNQPWGCRSMLFRDPDGNLVNFYTHTCSAYALLTTIRRRVNR